MRDTFCLLRIIQSFMITRSCQFGDCFAVSCYWSTPVHGCSYLLGQRFSHFSAYFVLKFALQRGGGRKVRECKLHNKAHRTFDPINTSSPLYPFTWTEYLDWSLSTCEWEQILQLYSAPSSSCFFPSALFALRRHAQVESSAWVHFLHLLLLPPRPPPQVSLAFLPAASSQSMTHT